MRFLGMSAISLHARARGSGSDTKAEVLDVMAIPVEHDVGIVLEHVSALEKDSHHHGAKEEVSDWEFDCNVCLLGGHDDAEEHHEHDAQNISLRPAHRHAPTGT